MSKSWSEFSSFCTVGSVGFVVNAVVVYGVREPTGLYIAEVIAFMAAASATWALNRAWTFSSRKKEPAGRQLRLFLIVNFAGFMVTMAIYSFLVAACAVCAREPIIPITVGAAAGLFINFVMSSALVFPHKELRSNRK
ncbi:MAG TPA: GtrA family protein [Methylocella sp.]|nr:GtrA family protein [Methylocella sp.]